jgi:hypothetical protein
MHYIKLNPTTTAVKLYPRLAMANGPHKSKRAIRRSVVPSAPGNTENQRDAASRQIRARLLHMIVENERVRRHERRPNAS